MVNNNDLYWGGPALFNNNMTIFGDLQVYGDLDCENISIPGSIIQVVGTASSSSIVVSTSGFTNPGGITGVSTASISIIGNSRSRIIVNFTGNVFCNNSGAAINPTLGYAVVRNITPPPQSIRTVGVASTAVFFSYNSTSIPASSTLTAPLSINFVDVPTPIERNSTVTYTLFVGITGATPASLLYNGSAISSPGMLGLSNNATGGFNPMTSTVLQEVLGRKR